MISGMSVGCCCYALPPTCDDCLAAVSSTNVHDEKRNLIERQPEVPSINGISRAHEIMMRQGVRLLLVIVLVLAGVLVYYFQDQQPKIGHGLIGLRESFSASDPESCNTNTFRSIINFRFSDRGY